jgi:hypothetical protein
MKKFLFTDGSGVKEAGSQSELEQLIATATSPEHIRIWIFNNNQWISYTAYRKLFPVSLNREKNFVADHTAMVKQTSAARQAVRTAPVRWVRKLVYMTGAAAGVFLVFNFTKIKWEKSAPLQSSAIRPHNMPAMDIDSLITEIEYDRGTVLDRSTRTNLRLRNTWPERILLQVQAEKETGGGSSRFSRPVITVDNTTGFTIDKGVVRLLTWKNNRASVADTFHISPIQFDKLTLRESSKVYKADSLSVEFESLRAKAFNFCYSLSTKNEPGAYNDRWFCKD